MEYTKTTDSGSQAGYTGHHWATCCTPPLYIYIYIPLLQAELGWRDTGMLQRKVNRQAGCDAQQMYGNDSAVAEGLRHAYSLDLQLYAHARMLFCRALAAAKRPSQSA